MDIATKQASRQRSDRIGAWVGVACLAGGAGLVGYVVYTAIMAWWQ